MVRDSDPKITMIYFHNLNRLQAGLRGLSRVLLGLSKWQMGLSVDPPKRVA